MKIKRIDFICKAYNEEEIEPVYILKVKTYRYGVAENSLWANCVRKGITFTHYTVEPSERVIRKY